MNIIGKRIILRGIENTDIPDFHSWANDPEIASGQGEVHWPSSMWQQNRWFERVQNDERNIRLAVQHKNGELIGYSGFWNINWRDRRAEHGLLIGNMEYRKQGFGREIILTCARYAFEELGFHRLDATILATNSASIKAYEACGYKTEGALRDHAYRGGVFVDRIMLGLLASDYTASPVIKNYWNE